MTIRLRAHHLLCLLTYVGKGYSPAFTANYDKVVKRLGEGEGVVIVSGPDDICAPLLGEPDPHCLRQSAAERDGLAARDVGALLGRPIQDGDRLVLDASSLAGMRQAFSAGLTRQACSGCEWSGLCDAVTAGGFSGTRLQAIPTYGPPRGIFGDVASFFKPDDCIVIRLAIEARPQKGHALTGKDRV